MKKDHLIQKAALFPQVFMVLPIVEGKPTERGTWAAYPNDESTTIWVNTSHVEAQKFYAEQIKMEEEYKMSKELTVQEDRTIKSMIAANMKAIKSILPKHLTPERFARIAYTSIVSNPKLARCTQLSLINVIIESSTLGLEIGGAMQEAALIPFKNNKTNPPTYEATLVPEYPGLIKLAKNTGDVKSITAHPVFSNDEFRYNYGLNPDLVHVPADTDRGELCNAYCIIWYMNGGVDFEVIDQKEADRAKAASAAKYQKDSPWNQKDNIPAMWTKTAIRRLMKRVPKSAEKRIFHDDLSGSEMTHISADANIINLSPDDFHSFSMTDEPEGSKEPPKDAEKKKEKKKAEPKREPPKDKKPSQEPSKAVKQAMFLKDNFPDEFKQAVEDLGLNGKIVDDKTAESICQKVDELVNERG